MKKLKVMTIVGTRPELIKLSEVIKKNDLYFDHLLVHTGQNFDYELNEIFFQELNIRKPDYFLNINKGHLGQNMGDIIAKSYEIMTQESPEAILILGDTNSGLSAISAKRLKIPIFHLEAGNRCFDENLPEEINRRIIDHISDVNLCYTEHARRYLNNEGINQERTYVVGSPMREILDIQLSKIEQSTILEKLNLEKKKYLLVSAHREENIDNEKNFLSIMNSLNEISGRYNRPIIYSAHPRSRSFIEQRKFKFSPNIKVMKPLGFFDYNQLQKNALCVISDSGTLAEEASYFKFPAVSLRTSTERPEALDAGNMIIGNIDTNSIQQSIDLSIQVHHNNEFGEQVLDYDSKNVSLKVIKIIQSYTEIINQQVWKKTKGSKN